MGFELMRRAVSCGAMDGVDTGSIFNREESTTGFLCKEVCLELFVAYVQN